jgi:hypothetical protein
MQYTFLLNHSYSAPTMLISEWIYGTNNKINLCILGKTTNIENTKEKEAKNNVVSFYPNPLKTNYYLIYPTMIIIK